MKHSNKVLVSNKHYHAERVYMDADAETKKTLYGLKTRTYILEKGLVDLKTDDGSILMEIGKEYTICPSITTSLLAYQYSEVLIVSTPDYKTDSWTDFSSPRNPQDPTRYTIDTDPERFTDHPWVDYDSY